MLIQTELMPADPQSIPPKIKRVGAKNALPALKFDRLCLLLDKKEVSQDQGQDSLVRVTSVNIHKIYDFCVSEMEMSWKIPMRNW